MPREVRNAVNLLWTTLIVGSAYWVWELHETSLPAEIAWADLLGVVGFTVIFGAVPIFFAARRRNWARWFLLLLTVAGVAASFWFAPEWQTWRDGFAEIVFTVAEVVGVYWLFTRTSSEWFRGKESGASSAREAAKADSDKRLK